MELIKNLTRLISGKSVRNGMWLYCLQIFNTVIPLITLPYITRVLGSYQYGTFSIVLNIVTYLQVLIEYGYALSATRQVALRRDNDQLNRLFTCVVTSRVLLFVCSLIFAFGYYLVAHPTNDESICLCVLSIGLIGYAFQQNWLYQGMQDMKFITIPSVIARVITTLCIFVFINRPEDIVLYCVLYSLSPIISNIIGTVAAIIKYNVRFVHVARSEIFASLKDGFYIFTTQLSSKVFGAIGITFLGIFATNSEVGIYSALYKIPYILLLLWSPISQVIYPITSKRIMNSFEDGIGYIKKIRRHCLYLLLFVSLIIALLAKPVTMIMFGEEYASSFYIIYPLLAWLIVSVNNNFLGVQMLVGSGHDKEYSMCFQSGVVATILFNCILIYAFKMMGAALAPLASELFLSVLLMNKVNIISKKN